jgi:hypothetical protein
LALITNLHASFAIICSGIPFSKSIIDSLVLAPHIISDSSRGAIRSYNYTTGNTSSIISKSKTGKGTSLKDTLFLGAKSTHSVSITTGEAQELDTILKRSESQRKMISTPPDNFQE